MTKKRILFFAEAVTLAHLARPLALIRTLGKDGHECVLACDPRHDRLIEQESNEHRCLASRVSMASVSSARFLEALASGKPVYDLPTLRSYVADDLALIDRVEPDLIIGDFRLSLSVSARVAGVPYAALTNAYWSPFYRHREFPLPVLPMTRFMPIAVARRLFQLAAPVAFPPHCRPLNALRIEYGMASLGDELRRTYTDADHVLYADDATLFALDGIPETHHFLGPVLWSPSVPVPAAWDAFDPQKPTVYLTLGSSGSAAVARQVYQAVDALGLNLIAATAGAHFPAPANRHTVVSRYVPGDAAAARSQLVICNGGSPTSQQALCAGVPVLGLAGNMDQFMNMDGLVRAGVGRVLRADRIGRHTVTNAAQEMLHNMKMRTEARRRAVVQPEVALQLRLNDAMATIFS